MLKRIRYPTGSLMIVPDQSMAGALAAGPSEGRIPRLLASFLQFRSLKTGGSAGATKTSGHLPGQISLAAVEKWSSKLVVTASRI